MSQFKIIAEWEQHQACLCALPNETSGWDIKDLDLVYDEVQYFLEKVIDRGQQRPFVLVGDSPYAPKLKKKFGHHITLLKQPYKDVWFRDIGPVNVKDRSGTAMLLNPRFNAWGQKYDFTLDQVVSSKIFSEQRDISDIFEGGALESNGEVLIVNEKCFDLPRGYKSFQEAYDRLANTFNLKIIPLNLQPLLGDDTDGHIDTMLRFVGKKTLVVDKRVSQNQKWPIFEEKLHSLLPEIVVHIIDSPSLGRLPATYVNFYFASSDLILMPSYGLKSDKIAQKQFYDATGGTIDVQAVPANTLVKQYGSWHCYALNIYKQEFFNA